jgi:hypothetical protein
VARDCTGQEIPIPAGVEMAAPVAPDSKQTIPIWMARSAPAPNQDPLHKADLARSPQAAITTQRD